MEKFGHIRHLTGIWFCFLFAGVFLWPQNTWGGVAGEQVIAQRIEALIQLQAELTGRLNSARSIRADLMTQDRAFVQEIMAAREYLSETTYDAAIANHRIRNNLKLVQLVTGYCCALDERIATCRHGLVKLKYLINRAEDELKLHKALNSFDPADLLNQIEQAIAEYKAEIKSDLIESGKMVIRSCESIWQDIIAGRL